MAFIGEDAEDLILLTDDQDKAVEAAAAYFREADIDLEYVHFDSMRPYWAVFEWEPEDAECPWTVRWDAAEGDDQAVHVYLLPA